MDLALGPLPDAGLDQAFRSEKLFYNDIVIAARRGHPLGSTSSLKELADCEWVLTGPETQGPGAAIFDAFRSRPRHLMDVSFRTPSQVPIMAHLAQIDERGWRKLRFRLRLGRRDGSFHHIDQGAQRSWNVTMTGIVQP